MIQNPNEADSVDPTHIHVVNFFLETELTVFYIENYFKVTDLVHMLL